MCGAVFYMKTDEGPKRFSRRVWCSNACANTSHGRSRSPEYRVWWSMLQRCNNPRSTQYHKYGGRGVSVCSRWHRFDAFFSDMGPRPSTTHSIDRIRGDGHYEPSNCRWATHTEQQHNLRNNRLLTFKGLSLPLRAWEMKLGYKRGVVDSRLRLGWTVEQALSTPPKRGNKPHHRVSL